MIQTGDRQFWVYQTIGWGIMALCNLLVQSIAGMPAKILLANTVLPFTFGLIITTLYRYLIKGQVQKIQNLRMAFLWVSSSTVLLTTLLITVIFALNSWVFGFPAPEMASLLSNFMIFGSILLIWNLIYFIVHYVNSWHQAELDKWKLATEMKDAQLGLLKSQINPHFVFNAINNIRSLILEDAEKAREMLVNFSDLFRYALRHSDQQLVPLQEELNMVKQYHELLSIQFEDKLDFQLQVDQGLDQISMPPMMLQLLIENAIKHGISQFKDGGLIHIQVKKQEQFLAIEVKNSGKLGSTSALGSKLGVGIRNIHQRLELLYNGRAFLGISEQDQMVTAVIKIPIA